MQVGLRPAPPVAEHPGHQRGSDKLTGRQRGRHDRRIKDRQSQFAAFDLTGRLLKRGDVGREQHQRAQRVEQGEQHFARHGHAEGRIHRAKPHRRRRGQVVCEGPPRADDHRFRPTDQVEPGDRGRFILDHQAVRPPMEPGVGHARKTRQFGLNLDEPGPAARLVGEAQAESVWIVGGHVQRRQNVAEAMHRPGGRRAEGRARRNVPSKRLDHPSECLDKTRGEAGAGIETDHGRRPSAIDNDGADARDGEDATEKQMNKLVTVRAEDARVAHRHRAGRRDFNHRSGGRFDGSRRRVQVSVLPRGRAFSEALRERQKAQTPADK